MKRYEQLFYEPPVAKAMPVGFEDVVCGMSQKDYEYHDLDEGDD